MVKQLLLFPLLFARRQFMRVSFTAGAQRALDAAAAWSSTQVGAVALDLPEVLLGLLAEPECRAAAKLAALGIGQEQVLAHWPGLQKAASPSLKPGAAEMDTSSKVARPFSLDLDRALAAAQESIAPYPPPRALATEHLLLGIALGRSAAAELLAQRGLIAADFEQELHQLYGYDPAPLVWDAEPREPCVAPANEPIPLAADSTSVSLGDRPRAEPRISGQHAALRAVDAAGNRAREALRVVEDYVRFVLDDRHLTERLKTMRHELAAACRRFSTGQLLAARDTQQDVGVGLATAAQRPRESLDAVALANFERLQESLRSLAEFGKVLEPAAVEAFERLRYEAYTLERAVVQTAASVVAFDNLRLYWLVDARPCEQSFTAIVQAALAGGVDVVQLRDKQLDDRTLLSRARLLRRLTRDAGARMIVNDRPDLALLADADGVHVGQEELIVSEARRILGPGRWVGVSTHSIEQARQAALDGADYLGVGPTFASQTKAFAEFPGLDFVRTVSQEIRLPAFVIGGVDRTNLPQAIAAGARRIAVSAAINNAPDPGAAAAQLKSLLRTL